MMSTDNTQPYIQHPVYKDKLVKTSYHVYYRRRSMRHGLEFYTVNSLDRAAQLVSSDEAEGFLSDHDLVYMITDDFQCVLLTNDPERV